MVSESLHNFFPAKNIKVLLKLNLVDQIILNISSSYFFILSESAKSAKINSLKVYRVSDLSISLMKPIVPTFLSFSGYCIKDTDCRDHSFSLNLFLRNILWQFYPLRYFVFSLPHDLMWPSGQRNVWLHGCIQISTSWQLTKFHGHKPCQRGYLTLLICHENTHHHVVRGSCDSIGGFLSL